MGLGGTCCVFWARPLLCVPPLSPRTSMTGLPPIMLCSRGGGVGAVKVAEKWGELPELTVGVKGEEVAGMTAITSAILDLRFAI